MQGNLKFKGGHDAGSIVNQGFITAGRNGDIYLIAPNIENSGIIQTEGGNLLLAAGESITITSLDLKDVHFEIQAPENEVLNLGKVLADGGAVNVFAGTLKHAGEIRADTVSVDETGTVILSAGKDIILESGSIVSASGTPGGVHDGGEVRIVAQDTFDFQRGAEIRVDGGTDGGDGGYLELSGKQKIALNGIFSGNAQAEGYRNGSLFIDPANINLTDSMGISGSIVVGTASREIAVSPDSSTVYVVVSGAASVVKVIDAATDTVTNTISVGSFSEGIAISSDGNYLYVTNASNDNISVISTATQTVVKTLAVGDSPNNVTVRPDTNRVYVTNGLGDSVSVIDSSDPPNASVITTIPVGDNPRNIAVTPDGSKVYVSNRNDNNVSVIDSGSNSVIGTINVGTNPRKIAAGPLGSDRIYVCNYLSNNVSVINTSTDTVVATPGAGGNPEGAAVSPDGSYLYVTNYSGATLTVLDTGTNSVVDTLTVGSGARGIAASPDGARVYVGNSTATDVSIAQLPTDDTGGDGVILETDSPGATFNINPANLFGAWTDVSLAATNDITVVVPIGDSDIPVGGSLTLDAGNNVNINADIGSIADYFEHDLFVNAGNTINVNADIFIAIEGSGFGDPDIVFSAGQAVNFDAAGRLDVVSMDTTADVVIEALSPVGAINMAAGSNITYTGNFSPGALVSLRADDVVLDGTISSTNSGVNIETYNAGRAIDLGTDTLGKLGLTNAELNNITASNISVTGLNSGDVTVSSPINLLSTDGLSILVQNLISIESGTGITVPLSLLLEGTDMDIQADLTANSKITLQTPGAGTPMEVGTSGPGAGVVALDQAELDHINVLGQLQIGQWDVPDITVTNPVSVPYQIYLRSQDNIHVNASLTASEITLRPGSDAGDVVNVAADLTATAGDIDVTLGTGVVNFTGSPTITASSFSAGTVNSGDGTVRFEAPLNITGDLNVTNTGNVELNQGGTYGGNFNVDSPANLEFAGGTHVFNGPSDFNGTGFYVLSGGSFGGAGTVTNYTIFDIMTGTSITPAFINAGTTSGSGTVDFQGGYTQTAGYTILMTGTNLAVTGPLTLDGGILMGDGTITGNVVNNGGVVNVGSSPGTLSIDGDYTQGPGGMLLIDLEGLTQGITYDLLDISGIATLDGMLYVSLIAPFDPAPSDTFQIITCGTACLGNFAVENPPAGKTMFVDYVSTDVTLSNILDAGPSLNQWILPANGNWDVGGNWTLGVPVFTQDVEIDLGSWVITIPASYFAEAGTLLVGANNTLSLLSGSTLDIANSATIDGDLSLIHI